MNTQSRRLFLRGAGRALLLLPTLPSLLPRAAWSQELATPLRYLQVMNPYGPNASIFYGGLTGDQRLAPNINARRLSSVSGNISSLIGAPFNGLKDKISVLRGLDVLIRNSNHHYCFATTASSYAAGVDNDEAPPVTKQASIDVLLSRSVKVYASAPPATRALVALNPVTTDDYANSRTFSWQPSAGGSTVAMLRPVKQTQAFYDAFSSGFGAMVMQPSVDPREGSLMQAVHAEYKAIRDGALISAADRLRLEAYMALINDIQREVSTPPPVPATSCFVPSREQETDVERRILNQWRILAAAMACDLTRVASITIGMSAGSGTRHAEHHAVGTPSAGYLADLSNIGSRVAGLIGELDRVVEGSGSLLDSSLVYWCQQYGCDASTDQHSSFDMPVLVAGKAGGALEPGWFVDYRREGSGRRLGVPLNNLLVTFFNAMGLGSSDYQLPGVAGYGDYPPGWETNTSRPDAARWNAPDGRRAPLPVIYKGPARG